MYANKKEMKKSIIEAEDEPVEDPFEAENTVEEEPGKREIINEETDPLEYEQDEDKPEYLDPSPLIEVEEDPLDEIELPDLENNLEDIQEEVPEEPMEDVPNLDEIVVEKATEKEVLSDGDGMMNDFERLLNQIQTDKENETRFKQLNDEKNRVKEKNTHILENQIKNNLKVEGDNSKQNEMRVQDQDTEDFKQRRDKALKLEEKERIKAEKLAEKERKKAEKAAEREKKRAKKKKKGNADE